LKHLLAHSTGGGVIDGRPVQTAEALNYRDLLPGHRLRGLEAAERDVRRGQGAA